MPVNIFEGNKAERVAAALERIAAAHDVDLTDLRTIQRIARSGQADQYFSPGDQIVPIWNYGAKELEMPMDVVAFHDAQDDENKYHHCLWLQSHWALPGVQFDASEAIWYCDEALPAGTYHFTVGTTWGDHCVKDKAYQFTLTKEIPVGGQIVVGSDTSFFTWGAPDVSPSKWRVYTFSNAKSVEPLDNKLELIEGSEGTDLGVLSNSTKYGSSGLNNLQRCAYGYNRWSQSAIRQWLNSDKPAGEWWEPKNVYDRPPSQLASMAGFLAGLPEDFLAIVRPTKVVTALNTVTDADIGTTETTYDFFFLPSLEQEYCQPQLTGAEGEFWPYWKERLGLAAPQAWYAENAEPKHIRHSIENHTSTQHVRFRSARRGSAYNAWYVKPGGYVYYYTATSALASAPACGIR